MMEDTASHPLRPSSKIVSSQSRVYLVPSFVLHLMCAIFTCVMLAGCSSEMSVVANTGWALSESFDDVMYVYEPSERYGPYECGGTPGGITIAFTVVLFVVIVIALVVSAMRLTKRFTHRLKRAGIILPILAFMCDSAAVGTFTAACVEGWERSVVDVSLIMGFIMLPVLLLICALQIADHHKTTTADDRMLGDSISPPPRFRVFLLVPASVLQLLCVAFTCVMLAGCSGDPSVVANTGWARIELEDNDDDDNYLYYFDNSHYGPSECGGATGDVTIVFTSILFAVLVIALVVSVMRLTKRFTHRLKRAGIILTILALICDSVAVGTFTADCVVQWDEWEVMPDPKVDVSLILGFTMLPVFLIILALQMVEYYQSTTTVTTVTTNNNDDYLKQLEARVAAAERVQQQQYGTLEARLGAVELQQGKCPPTYFNSPVVVGTTGL